MEKLKMAATIKYGSANVDGNADHWQAIWVNAVLCVCFHSVGMMHLH